MIFVPHFTVDWSAIHQGEALVNGIPLLWLLHVLDRLIAGDILQKLILLGILTLTGYTMYVAVPTTSVIGKYFAGCFYLVNPFVYERFMAGHWIFLLAYACMPLFLRSLVSLYAVPSWQRTLIASLIWTAIGWISPHHLIIAGLAYLCLSVALVRSWSTLKCGVSVLLYTGLCSLGWIAPTLTGHNFTQVITSADYAFFSTQPDFKYGLLPNILAMYGFWHRGWILAKEHLPLWPLLSFFGLIPVFLGVGVGLKTKAPIVTALLLMAACAAFLASGLSPATSEINGWIFRKVPGFWGLREAEKFSSLLVLAYAYLSGLGIDWLVRLEFAPRYTKTILISLPFLLLAILSYPLFWANGNRIRTVNYPTTWSAMSQVGVADCHERRILILPWTKYVEGSFAGRLIANPGKTYFGCKAIASQDSALSSLPDSKDAFSEAIKQAVTNQDADRLAQLSREANVQYVLLSRSTELPDTKFLFESPKYFHPYLRDRQTNIFLLTDQNL